MLRDETIRRVIQFRDDREWRQFHTPKDLAISLSLEAAELLEQKGIHAGVVKLNRVSPLGPEEAAAITEKFDLRQAVIYSEILKPRFDEE